MKIYPAEAKASTQARPMPFAPPVTIMLLSFNLVVSIGLLKSTGPVQWRVYNASALMATACMHECKAKLQIEYIWEVCSPSSFYIVGQTYIHSEIRALDRDMYVDVLGFLPS